MDNVGKTKEYSNGELTVVWQSDICIHAGNCTRMLPKVYNPEVRPWISVANATTDELKVQIDACPSGALSYKLANSQADGVQSQTNVEVKNNGPLIIEGNLKVVKANGQIELRTKKTAFCRCGASGNKPFCDGSHAKIGFEG